MQRLAEFTLKLFSLKEGMIYFIIFLFISVILQSVLLFSFEWYHRDKLN